MWCCNHGGGGGVLRRTRSSRPGRSATRHPWRVTVRHNTPSPPPDVVCPPCIKTGCPLRGNQRIQALSRGWIVQPLNIAVSTSIAERSRGFEFTWVVHVRCAGPSRAMDGASRAPTDGFMACPVHRTCATHRHPKSPCEVPRRRATRKTRSNPINSADTGHWESVATTHTFRRARGSRRYAAGSRRASLADDRADATPQVSRAAPRGEPCRTR